MGCVQLHEANEPPPLILNRAPHPHPGANIHPQADLQMYQTNRQNEQNHLPEIPVALSLNSDPNPDPDPDERQPPARPELENRNSMRNSNSQLKGSGSMVTLETEERENLRQREDVSEMQKSEQGTRQGKFDQTNIRQNSEVNNHNALSDTDNDQGENNNTFPSRQYYQSQCRKVWKLFINLNRQGAQQPNQVELNPLNLQKEVVWTINNIEHSFTYINKCTCLVVSGVTQDNARQVAEFLAGNCKNVYDLDLDGNRFNNQSLGLISTLPLIQNISMKENPDITHVGVAHFKAHKSLKCVGFGHNIMPNEAIIQILQILWGMELKEIVMSSPLTSAVTPSLLQFSGVDIFSFKNVQFLNDLEEQTFIFNMEQRNYRRFMTMNEALTLNFVHTSLLGP